MMLLTTIARGQGAEELNYPSLACIVQELSKDRQLKSLTSRLIQKHITGRIRALSDRLERTSGGPEQWRSALVNYRTRLKLASSSMTSWIPIELGNAYSDQDVVASLRDLLREYASLLAYWPAITAAAAAVSQNHGFFERTGDCCYGMSAKS
jgi:hypothetical protein